MTLFYDLCCVLEDNLKNKKRNFERQKNPIIFSRNAGFENIQSMHPFFRKMHFCVKLSVIFLGFFKRFKHLFYFCLQMQ